VGLTGDEKSYRHSGLSTRTRLRVASPGAKCGPAITLVDVDFARNLDDNRHSAGDDDSGGPMAFARDHWFVVASAAEIGGP